MSESKPSGAKKPRSFKSLKTALWLLIPPVGLTLMWRRDCRWHPAVKAGITTLMAAALVAVFLLPTPDVARGGVDLVTSKPEVEIYGPDLPTFIVPGYTNDQTFRRAFKRVMGVSPTAYKDASMGAFPEKEEEE